MAIGSAGSWGARSAAIHGARLAGERAWPTLGGQGPPTDPQMCWRASPLAVPRVPLPEGPLTFPPPEGPSTAIPAPPLSLPEAAHQSPSLPRGTPPQQNCLHSGLPVYRLLHSVHLDVQPIYFILQSPRNLAGIPGCRQEFHQGLAPLLLCLELMFELHRGVFCALVLEHVKDSLDRLISHPPSRERRHPPGLLWPPR